jgi:hypothetical protein
MEDEVRALLTRVMIVPDDLDAGRLDENGVLRFIDLGQRLDRALLALEGVEDRAVFLEIWREHARPIETFLDRHFARPRLQ